VGGANLRQLAGMSKPLEPMRRRDRAQDEAWIRHFLRHALFGVLATVADGRPFLNSNLFLFDEGEVHDGGGTVRPDGGDRIYLHTARTGRTPDHAERGGPATFSTSVMGRLLPAPEALEFSVEYAGVVTYGTLHAVTDEGEKRRVLEGIMAKYAPHLEPVRDYRPVTPEELTRTAVHRLEIESWSGKQKVVDPGFPGAYVLPDLAPPVRVAGPD